MEKFDVIIVGAGAAGLMCAIEASKRGRRTLILDHANKPGKKILMSGGGRCNFTNLHITPNAFISHNPHFCKSALSRYTAHDFIDLVKHYQIPFHEKTLGQLFCDDKSKDILEMLLSECHKTGSQLRLNTHIQTVEKIADNAFNLKTDQGDFRCESLVIASGGLSIPTMGASPWGYKLAAQFNLNVWPLRAGLVPFTLHTHDKEKYSELSGVSISAIVKTERSEFTESILFSHRGLSGPAMLQSSSYWEPGETIEVTMLPHLDLVAELMNAKKHFPQRQLNTVLATYFPKRLIDTFVEIESLEKTLQSCSQQKIESISATFQRWQIKPNGTEGYRTAEVTLGGVDCDAISSKTMEALSVSGLYFIGEVLDVTGWLGGYNFQWAWSSGWAAGQVA